MRKRLKEQHFPRFWRRPATSFEKAGCGAATTGEE
jgi:hypothetical protein